MKVFIFLTLLTAIITFNLRQAKQTYDSYVMAVQWPNGFCKVSPCGNKAEQVYKNTLTIHGLWPTLKTGKQLGQCTNGVSIDEDDSQLFRDLKQYWPSFSSTNKSFWEHEYNKHGFCMVEEYGWDGYEEFFQFVIDLYLKSYKDLITRAFPNASRKIISVSYSEMKKRIQQYIPNATFKMNCKVGFITEFQFYLDKHFSPETQYRVVNSCEIGKLVFN